MDYRNIGPPPGPAALFDDIEQKPSKISNTNSSPLKKFLNDAKAEEDLAKKVRNADLENLTCTQLLPVAIQSQHFKKAQNAARSRDIISNLCHMDPWIAMKKYVNNMGFKDKHGNLFNVYKSFNISKILSGKFKKRVGFLVVYVRDIPRSGVKSQHVLLIDETGEISATINDGALEAFPDLKLIGTVAFLSEVPVICIGPENYHLVITEINVAHTYYNKFVTNESKKEKMSAVITNNSQIDVEEDKVFKQPKLSNKVTKQVDPEVSRTITTRQDQEKPENKQVIGKQSSNLKENEIQALSNSKSMTFSSPDLFAPKKAKSQQKPSNENEEIKQKETSNKQNSNNSLENVKISPKNSQKPQEKVEKKPQKQQDDEDDENFAFLHEDDEDDENSDEKTRPKNEKSNTKNPKISKKQETEENEEEEDEEEEEDFLAAAKKRKNDSASSSSKHSKPTRTQNQKEKKKAEPDDNLDEILV